MGLVDSTKCIPPDGLGESEELIFIVTLEPSIVAKLILLFIPHKYSTSERWSASVSEDFRFSEKVPRTS